MIVGLGSLGSVLLELLAREEGIGEIVAAGRDERRGTARCNLARVGAMAQDRLPRVRFVRLDLSDIDGTAEIIARESADVVVSTASRETWWLSELLPSSARQAIGRARFGAWLPVHLALAIKFMQAVRAADYRGHTVIASFPDIVNVVLGRLGLAPTCGLGNLDEIVAKVRDVAASRLETSPRDVRVLLVAHHALEPFVFRNPAEPTHGSAPAEPEREPPPYWIRVELTGEDVTAQVDAAGVLFAPYPLPPGPAWHFLTAGSAVRLIRALVVDGGCLLHVPAPHGLPGGYPAVASRAGVSVANLAGLPAEEAVAINERSHRFDGVEQIERDGTTCFTAGTVAALRETLGYNVERLRPADCDDAADELLARFARYAAGHGVDVAAARAISRLVG
jgi:hypothetical protein